MATKRIEYMCSYCGKKELWFVSMGKPHTWTVNRKFKN